MPDESTANFVDSGGIVREAGELVYPAATVGDVLTVQADQSIAAAAGGGGTSAVPLAEQASDAAEIDATTYDNTVTGAGKLRVVVGLAAVDSGDVPVVGIAVEGDAFPRWLWNSDSFDGLWMGDGTFDLYGNGPVLTMHLNGDGSLAMELQGGSKDASSAARLHVGWADPNIGATVQSDSPFLVGPGGVQVAGGTLDPNTRRGGNVGDLWLRTDGDPTANTYMYACTTAGAAADAVWTPLVTS